MARAPAKAPLLLLLASLALLAPAASAARTLLQVVGQEPKACSSNDDCSPGIGGNCCGRDGVCHPNGEAQCLPVDCCPRGQPCKPGQTCCGASDVNCPATGTCVFWNDCAKPSAAPAAAVAPRALGEEPKDCCPRGQVAKPGQKCCLVYDDICARTGTCEFYTTCPQ